MLTINEALALQKIVRERVSELRSLRSSVSTIESYYSAGERERKTEPQYEVKVVDRKITQLEMFLFKVDSKIKQANAVNQIDVKETVDELLAPLD